MQGGREKAFADGVICPHGSEVTAVPNDRSKVRAVLLGGSGLLGGALRQVWAARPEIELVPLSRAELNLTQPDRIDAALEELEFDLLVNAAAYTRVDDAETAGGRELAMTVNGEAAGRLAVCAAARGAKLLHFCNPPGCSWLEWGQRILDTATAYGAELQTRRLTPVAIADLHGMAAPRPAYSVMDTGRFAAISGRAAADWTEWLPQMAGKV